jgi:4-hydroxy-3-polyprenylbenzoate decarboxylase
MRASIAMGCASVLMAFEVNTRRRTASDHNRLRWRAPDRTPNLRAQGEDLVGRVTVSDAMPQRLIVGVSGASGAVYGLRLLEACAELGVESHLVASRAAALTVKQELGLSLADLGAKAGVVHRPADVGASIATGVTSSLLTRAADVTLKERRPLVLMVRETPLHLGHLRTMVRLAEMGAIIAPPLPAFYAMPPTIAAMVDQSVGRALDLFGLSWAPVQRWGQDIGPIAGAEA